MNKERKYMIFHMNKEKSINEIIKDILYIKNKDDRKLLKYDEFLEYSYDIIIFNDINDKLDFISDYFNDIIDRYQYHIDDFNEFLLDNKEYYIYDNNILDYRKFSYDELEEIEKNKKRERD